MRKAALIVLGLALAVLATGTGGGGTPVTFTATIGGIAVDVVLPNSDWSKGTVSLNKFIINGPSGAIITVVPLPTAAGLGTNDMDALCKDKLAEKANAATTGTKIVVSKNTEGVTYALRLYETGGNVFFVGVSGTDTCGILLSTKVPATQKIAVRDAMKSILNTLALSD